MSAGPTPASRLRPWGEVRAPALRPIVGVLTDIDDTLTHDGVIEPAALEALHHLQSGGLPVIAVTGRPTGWSEPFVLQWPVRAIVAENGGVLLQRQDGRVQHRFAQDGATRVRHSARLSACGQAVLREVPGAFLAQDSAGRLTDIAVDHSEFQHLDAAQIEAVCAVMRRHGLQATVSSIHINGWLGDHDKWTGACWAVESVSGLPLNPETWIYVGDSTNDQLMFEKIPLSVGVANIADFVQRLKVLPAFVTAGARGLGFAQVADALIATRDSGRD